MPPLLNSVIPENDSEGVTGDGLKLLLVTDPRCQTLPLIPHNFDSWGTVYAYFIAKSLASLGAKVEMESISQIAGGSSPSLDNSNDFDAAIIIVNRASSIYGQELFSEIKKIIRPGGKIFSLDDHDREIGFEDLRFAATLIRPDSDVDRKHQIYWGCDPDYLVPRKKPDTLRILLDTWHFDQEKWDRTRDILSSAIDFFSDFDTSIIGRKEVEILAWGKNGPERMVNENDCKKLERIPPRLGFEDMMKLLSETDIFMVTHSESMGLTILEAAMAGCLVAIPVPETGDESIGFFIKPDLASTITRFEYPLSSAEIVIPWYEIVTSLDAERIRSDVLQMTWKSVSERMMQKILENLEIVNNSPALPDYNNDSVERKRMLSSIQMIEGTKNWEILADYYISWILNPNFDDYTRNMILSMIRENIPSSALDSSIRSNGDIIAILLKRDFQKNEHLSEAKKEEIEEILGLDLSFSMLNHGVSELNSGLIYRPVDIDSINKSENKWKASREEIMRVLEIIDSNDFLHQLLIMLDIDEEISNWSIGRIVQTFFSEEEGALSRLVEIDPHNLDLWKILIRKKWENGKHLEAQEICSRAKSFHNDDEWLTEIGNREVSQ